MKAIIDFKTGNTIINGVVINDKIFNQELYDYRLVEKETLIDDLIKWIAESDRKNDKSLMLDDLEYILKLPDEDEFVFSSINTNEYIAFSDNPSGFDEICLNLLELNEEQSRIGDDGNES